MSTISKFLLKRENHQWSGIFDEQLATWMILMKGKNGKADATFALTDADAVALFDRSLNPQTAFMQGKMKIKGNIGSCSKVHPRHLPTSIQTLMIEAKKYYSY